MISENRSQTPEQLPRGTVTFLFTDIVGSTRMAQASLEDYQVKLERNRRLIRAAAGARSGFELGHEGDSFFISFERASDAVAAAEQARRDLEREVPELPVRFGIHTGEAVVTADGYVGVSVHQARRICDAANGFQILVSDATASLVASLPDGTSLHDIGRYRLKDLGEPVHLFELQPSEGAGSTQRPRSLDTIPNNLPIQLTNLVGREEDLIRLSEQLKSRRLVTITGPGGIGKTRLAYQVAGESLELFPDGVWSAELAPVVDPNQVASTVARILGIDGRGQQPDPNGAVSWIVKRFGSAHALLFIDNCEHVIDEGASFVHRLLTSCPNVSVLVTSRQPLAVPGEALYPLPPLEIDASEDEPSEAARMFIERATTRDPSLSITKEDLADILELCRALDGIPLAIELAASRVGSMSPKEILDHFRDSPLEFAVGPRTGSDRHRTLRAAIDWSFDLLDDAERLLLRRLSFMAGSFTAESAREICGGRGLAPASVPTLVASLVEKSLLMPVRRRPETTFRMLDTIRAYAAERLREAGRSDHPRLVSESVRYRFTRQGDVWAVGVPGSESRLRSTKGFALVHKLLQQPGVEVHALDLMGGTTPSGKVVGEGLAVDPGSGLEALDSTARDQLRTRLEGLAQELREAEENNDQELVSRLGTEMQQITDHLAAALGLGGKPRSSSSQAERARLAATKAIRAAISRIGEHEKVLGRLLSQCVKTGTFCSYEPPAVPSIEWILD